MWHFSPKIFHIETFSTFSFTAQSLFYNICNWRKAAFIWIMLLKYLHWYICIRLLNKQAAGDHVALFDRRAWSPYTCSIIKTTFSFVAFLCLSVAFKSGLHCYVYPYHQSERLESHISQRNIRQYFFFVCLFYREIILPLLGMYRT